MTLLFLIEKNIYNFLFQMIPYLLLYHLAKFEGQEAMGRRQALELNQKVIEERWRS